MENKNCKNLHLLSFSYFLLQITKKIFSLKSERCFLELLYLRDNNRRTITFIERLFLIIWWWGHQTSTPNFSFIFSPSFGWAWPSSAPACSWCFGEGVLVIHFVIWASVLPAKPTYSPYIKSSKCLPDMLVFRRICLMQSNFFVQVEYKWG